MRDVYEVEDKLLIVATDRISAFDVVLPNPIPGKGEVLTQISLFWFDYISDIVENHLISAEVDSFPTALREYKEQLQSRSMLVRRANVVPIECVVRGYLAGSGWKEYRQTGEVCGIKLPAGLVESSRLPEPIFTPATKVDTGHDQNISENEMANIIGRELTDKLKDLSLRVYAKASRYAAERGIIICDTKFEFGIADGKLIIVDEVLTPDSSRFWPAESYQAGRPQPSYDKQYVRDYLESIQWNKQPPAPELPPEVIEATSAKYLEAYRILVGRELEEKSLGESAGD